MIEGNVYRWFDKADQDFSGQFDTLEEALWFRTMEPGWQVESVVLQKRECSPWVDSE